MTFDPDRIMKKIGYVEEQISALRRLIETSSRAELLNDPWLIRGIKYSIQTAIEAIIDIAYHICAKKFLYAPSDARDALRRLKEEGWIDDKELSVYSGMIGFRNRLVHGYQEVSPERLYDIVTEGLRDLEVFIERVLRYVMSV